MDCPTEAPEWRIPLASPPSKKEMGLSFQRAFPIDRNVAENVEGTGSEARGQACNFGIVPQPGGGKDYFLLR